LEFLTEYGTFLAKAITIVIAIIAVIGSIVSMSGRNKKHSEGQIEITNLTEDFNEVKDGMLEELMSEEEYKLLQKQKKKEEKAKHKAEKKRLKSEKKQVASSKQNSDESKVESTPDSDPKSTSEPDLSSESKIEDEKSADEKVLDENNDNDASDLNERALKGRLFVIDFDGDIEASAVENLREEITAIISAASADDHVLIRLESPGGMVHSYGLAASQLSRIKAANLRLIVAVDQVAASGGYMMACVADEIIAAPFAVVGSIGVVAELPNFHRLLKHNKVDYEQHTAGEFKRTLTMFSENTDTARKKFKQELEETHDLFKQFIKDNRPSLDIDNVATGEHWYGTQAIDLGLIDKIQTSDDYIVSAIENNDVYEIAYEVKKPLAERLSFSVHSAIEKGIQAIWQKSLESRLFK